MASWSIVEIRDRWSDSVNGRRLHAVAESWRSCECDSCRCGEFGAFDCEKMSDFDCDCRRSRRSSSWNGTKGGIAMSTWLTNVRLEVSEQVSQVSEDGHIQTLKVIQPRKASGVCWLLKLSFFCEIRMTRACQNLKTFSKCQDKKRWFSLRLWSGSRKNARMIEMKKRE